MIDDRLSIKCEINSFGTLNVFIFFNISQKNSATDLVKVPTKNFNETNTMLKCILYVNESRRV